MKADEAIARSTYDPKRERFTGRSPLFYRSGGSESDSVSLESELSSVSIVSPRLWRQSIVVDAVRRASPPA